MIFHRIDESTFGVSIPGLAWFTVGWDERPIVLRKSQPTILLWLFPTVWSRGRWWWPEDPRLRGQFLKNGVPLNRGCRLGPLDIRYQGRPDVVRRVSRG